MKPIMRRPIDSRRAQVILACAFAILLPLPSGARIRPMAPAMQQARETAEQHLKQGQAAYNAGQYAKAREELKRALKLDKQMAEAYLWIGMTCGNEGKILEAIDNVKQAIKLRSPYPDAHYTLSVLYFGMRRVAQARAEVDLAISQDANFANAYYLKGKLEILGEHYKDALAAFEQALRLAPAIETTLPTLPTQMTALREWVAFRARKDDPAYKQAEATNSPAPRYTDQARAARIQGAVHLAVLIDETGSITATVMFLGLGYGLDEEALRAARKVKFKPATINGKPVPFWQMMAVEFNLGR